MKDFEYKLHCGECGSLLDLRFTGTKVMIFWCPGCGQSHSIPSNQFPSPTKETNR